MTALEFFIVYALSLILGITTMHVLIDARFNHIKKFGI